MCCLHGIETFKELFCFNRGQLFCHTSATLQLLSDINIKQVSGSLGHSDLRVTNQYLHCIAEADEAAAHVLQEMLITQKGSSEQAETKHKIQNTG